MPKQANSELKQHQQLRDVQQEIKDADLKLKGILIKSIDAAKELKSLLDRIEEARKELKSISGISGHLKM